MKKTLFLLLACMAVSFLHAQTDVADSEDHPLLTRYPGSYISFYETVKFREYTLATGPVTGYRHIEQKQTLEGQLHRITYYIDKHADNLSIGEVYKDYKLALEKAGISLLAKGSFPQRNVSKEVGGGGWMGLSLGANPFPMNAAGNLLFAGTSSSGGTFALIGRVNRPNGPTYVAIYGERHSNDKAVVHVDVIEVGQAETGLVTANADYIKSEIEDRGSIAIYGIAFEYDKSDIKPESKPALDEIAKYLKDNPTISLYIVGHTDMKGTYAYNLKLSQDRARALGDALIHDYGIASDRLTPYGVAFLAPRATNGTDEGRAVNRRTELVKRF